MVRSANRSYRVDEDVDAQLQELAFRERVSVNVVANRALRHYVEWESTASKIGFISMPRTLRARLFARLTESEASEIGRWAGENLMVSLSMFFFKKVDYDSVLDLLRLLASRARIFDFEYAKNNDGDVLIVKHGSGRMMSVYMQALLSSLLERCVGSKVQIQTTEDQVVAQVPTRARIVEGRIPNF